jgi:hypothetical protein
MLMRAATRGPLGRRVSALVNEDKETKMAVTRIDPTYWLGVANKRAPKVRGLTPWFHGSIAPHTPGWYERHFTDSQIIPAHLSRHWWSGSEWHWRQVGDYPCWRGLTCAAFMSPSRYPIARRMCRPNV